MTRQSDVINIWSVFSWLYDLPVESAGAVEYTDCIPVEE